MKCYDCLETASIEITSGKLKGKFFCKPCFDWRELALAVKKLNKKKG
jgi:hypothetical protein